MQASSSPTRMLSQTGLASLSLTAQLDVSRLRLHSRTIMIALSHLIEEHAAAAGADTILIATFQRFSLLRAEAERYQSLAPRLGQVYALGVADTSPPTIPNTTIVPLEVTWPLVQEWVVIVSGPTICMALFAQDAEGFRLHKRSREYHGYWTSNPLVVDAAVDVFFNAVGLPRPVFARDPRTTFQSARTLQAQLSRLTKA
jgi:DICT domain-containing protein